MGPEAGLATPDRDGGRRPLRRRRSGCTTTAIRSPRASASRRARAPHARRRRRRVRRARRRQPPHPRVPARAAHRPPGEDRVLAARESFLGHVHRHPARIWMRPPRRPPTASSSASRRASCSTAARTVASSAVAGQRRVLRRRARTGARTRSSRAGRCARTTRRAARCAGFGVVQACFAHEAQMDLLADALRHRPGRAPAAQRAGARRRAAHRPGHRRRAAGRARSSATAPRCPLPPAGRRPTCSALPGGAGRTARPRPTCGAASGFAVGFKNLMYAEGYDDCSTARAARRRASPPSRARRPRSGRASSRWCSRSRARCSASTMWSSRRPTRRSGRPAPPRRAGRRWPPGRPCTRPAWPSGTGCCGTSPGCRTCRWTSSRSPTAW